MRLTLAARDWLLGQFASRLNAGSLVIYTANPESHPLQVPLVSVSFASPAFLPVLEGRAEAVPLPPAQITATGEARWAELLTSAREVLLHTRVRETDDPQAESGDVLVDRLDFQRGGVCTLMRVTLTLPLQS